MSPSSWTGTAAIAQRQRQCRCQRSSSPTDSPSVPLVRPDLGLLGGACTAQLFVEETRVLFEFRLPGSQLILEFVTKHFVRIFDYGFALG